MKSIIKSLISRLPFNSKPEYQKHDKFWVQNVNFQSIPDRIPFFKELCFEKKVIHFGCTDWPIFDPSYNLHIKLAEVANSIHGFDIDKQGIDNLKQYVNQPYFSSIEALSEEYDICLVPETIEHVENVGLFLKELSQVKAKEFYITAPNCFAQVHMKRNWYESDKIKEVVHPDHNCWYSPFTLKNVIEKYSNLEVVEVFLLNNDTMVCCKAVPK